MEQPDWLILEICEHFERDKRVEANISSFTEARGWAMLYNGFAGDSAKPMNPVDLLPFPDELKDSKDNEPRKVSEETERIARALLKSEKLPPHIVAQIEPIL